MTADAAGGPPGLPGRDQGEFKSRKSLGPAGPTKALAAAPSDGTTVTQMALNNRDAGGITVTPPQVCRDSNAIGRASDVGTL